jgi:hypothetical protein
MKWLLKSRSKMAMSATLVSKITLSSRIGTIHFYFIPLTPIAL